MRIPKIIYTTWISDKPLPGKFNKYIESWKRHLPAYEIRMLTMDNIPENKFIDTFIQREKYAVAAQYARALKIYETGGIYLDIDVEVIKNFDELLHFEMFAGIENKGENHFINNAVFGAAVRHPFLKDCMEYMDAIDVDREDIEIGTGPLMFTELMKHRGWIPENKDVHHCGECWKYVIAESPDARSIQIFNSKYFYPYLPDEQFTPECITNETYAIHHWAATWKNSVSVIILCNDDDDESIKKTIMSARDQSVKPIEIILINKSGDHDDEKLIEMARKFKIKFIRKSNECTPVAAINRATDFAKGKWILLLNAGDMIGQNLLKSSIDKSDIVEIEIEIDKQTPVTRKYIFRKEVWEKLNFFDEDTSEEETFEVLIKGAKNAGYRYELIKVNNQ